jgi:hypothetical protein
MHARRSFLTLLPICLLPRPAWSAELLSDDFSSPRHPNRRALRGPWQFATNTARCTQDDALYAKSKNQGPILIYDADFTDAVISFQFKPEPDCKTFVFTVNTTAGHVFRFVTSSRGTNLRAFPPGPQDHASISLGHTGPELRPGQWTPVTVTLQGDSVTVKIGEGDSQTVEHASFARPKINLSLGFSFGTMAFKDLKVSLP